MPDPTPPPSTTSPVKPPALPSKKSLFLTLLGLGLFLFVMVFVFLVVLLLQNGGNNPLLGALGVEPALFQQLLKTIISIVFGFLGFIAFILFLVGLFRRLTSTAQEVDKKRQSLIMAAVSFFSLLFFVGVWIVLYFYISQITFGTQGAAVILSSPEDTLNMTAPVDINFSARTIEQLYEREGIISYAWDLDADKKFDDGNGRDIQYRYEDRGNADGRYRVAVKVILGNGKEVITERDVTIANVLPTIVIDYEPKLLEVPLEMTFNAGKSKDPDGNIISYDWDFTGDSAPDAQGKETKWNFTEAVKTNVTLSLTDNNGMVNKKTIVLDLLQGKKKQAVIAVKPGLSGDTPFKITVDGSASFIDEKIQDYEWNFGDGSFPQQGRTLHHEYTVTGEYVLKLRIEGASGKSYEVEEKISVGKRKSSPSAVLKVLNHSLVEKTLSGKAPLKLDLSAADSTDRDGKIIEYRWDFNGDSTPESLGVTASHTFVQPGSFTITLLVIDDDELSSSDRLKIDVLAPGIQVDISANTVTGPVPLEVVFDASASRADKGKIISYTWDFADKSPQIIGSAKQTHQFSDIGEYLVKVTILTDLQERQTGEVLIVVRDIELQADFTVQPSPPKAGEKVFFDASISQGQITRYYFEFGDGSISRIIKPEHVYDAPGSYRVQLEVYDRKNRLSRKTLDLKIE